MKFPPFVSLFALVLACAASAVQAERADRDRPMQVEADKMQHDETRQWTQLLGSVQAVKGTLVMRAARMEVQQDAQGQQQARLWAENGQRVFFRQKREGLDEFVEGEAVQAEYDSRLDRMVLTGSAEIRVLREGRLADQMQGQRIVYDNATEVVSIDGKAQGGAVQGRQRARAILAPKASASAPAVALPVLRPSTGMQAAGGKP